MPSFQAIHGANALSISLWFNQTVDSNNNSTYNGLFMTREARTALDEGGQTGASPWRATTRRESSTGGSMAPSCRTTSNWRPTQIALMMDRTRAHPLCRL